MKKKVNRRQFISAAGAWSAAAAGAAEPASKEVRPAGAPVCACVAAPKLIFPCSGAADVGAIADRAARKLTHDLDGKMFCLAGIAARIPGMLETTKCASKIVVIDGCPQDCARKTLEAAGFAQISHVKLYELGMERGKTPETPEAIAKVADVVRPILES